MMTTFKSLLSGKRCLVLDDEFLIALDIQQFLENAGAHVVCTGNTKDALAAIQTNEFDLAVLDVKMSGAASTSRTVAAALAEKGVPFVFLTGMRRDEVHRPEFAEAPIVEKPYEVQILIEPVTRALGRPAS